MRQARVPARKFFVGGEVSLRGLPQVMEEVQQVSFDGVYQRRRGAIGQEVGHGAASSIR
jgi:hypothetical protein